MSSKVKRLFKKIVSYAGIFFFILAVGMLWWQLKNYSLTDIVHAITDIPRKNLLFACIACFAGYVALSLYDFLALKYVGGDDPSAHTISAGRGSVVDTSTCW